MGQQFTPDLEQAAYLGVKLASSRAKGSGARARKVLLLCNVSTWLRKPRRSCSIGAQDSAQRRRLRHGSSTTAVGSLYQLQSRPSPLTPMLEPQLAAVTPSHGVPLYLSRLKNWRVPRRDTPEAHAGAPPQSPQTSQRLTRPPQTSVVTANAASDCATRE